MAPERGSFKWSDEQIRFVIQRDRDYTAREISELFNERFKGEANITEEQTKYVRHRNRNNPKYTGYEPSKPITSILCSARY